MNSNISFGIIGILFGTFWMFVGTIQFLMFHGIARLITCFTILVGIVWLISAVRMLLPKKP